MSHLSHISLPGCSCPFPVQMLRLAIRTFPINSSNYIGLPVNCDKLILIATYLCHLIRGTTARNLPALSPIEGLPLTSWAAVAQDLTQLKASLEVAVKSAISASHRMRSALLLLFSYFFIVLRRNQVALSLHLSAAARKVGSGFELSVAVTIN